RVEENLHVEFLENKAIEKGSGPNWLFDIDSLTKSMNYVPVDAGTISTNLSGTKDATSQEVKKDVSSLRYIALPNWAHDALLEFSLTDHIETLIVETPILTISSPVPTAFSTDSQEPSSDARLISKRVANQEETPSLDNILSLTNQFEDILGVEPKKIFDALQDPSWVEAMHEEILQFKIQNVWTLVDYPKGVRPIGTKWVLKNKKDEIGIIIRNKARLVVQGHTQEEGIDYDEVFTHVARIEAIILFLAYASFMGFIVYQMDVKSAFLYGTIGEKVYVMQPPRFQDPEFQGKVYKVEKAMCGLHQAPRAWSSNTPMDKKNPWGKDETRKDVDLHLYRSMIGSLMYLTASRPDIMFAVCACARHQVTPKECHLHAVKRIFKYLKGHPKLELWYPKESPFDLVAYLDSDYGGTIVATSTTEAEYVAAASCYGQCKLFPLLGKLSTISVFLGFGLTFAGTSKYWGVLRILMISLRLIPLVSKEKGEFNVNFHPMVDFIEASPLRINLKLQDEEGISSLPDTELFENLTLMGYNISPNQKFTFQKRKFSHQWKYLIHTIMQCISPKSTGFNEFSSHIATARVCLATNRTYNFSKMIFDGLVKNVNNKISKLLMYPRFLTICLRMSQFVQITHNHTYVIPFHTRKPFTTLRVNSPSFSGRIVPLFDTMLVQLGEGSGTPTKPHHTPSPEALLPSHTTHTSPSLPHVTTTFIPTVTLTKTTPIRQYTQRARIAQSFALPSVADEPASPQRDVSQGEAFPTDSGFVADQDRANIAKTSTLPHESTSRVTSLAADEGSLQLRFQELTDFCTSLQRQQSKLVSKFTAQAMEITELKVRVKFLEDRQGDGINLSGDDAPIKGRRLDEEEVATEKVSSDTKDIILDEEEVAVEKVSDDTEEMATVLITIDAASVLSTVAPANVSISTGSGVVPTASTTISTATPIFATATIFARELEEELEREAQRMNAQIGRDEEIAKIHAEEELQQMIEGWKVKDFKGMSFKEVKAKFKTVWKQIEDFIPMGSTEEAERIKRKGINLEQESAKKQKASEEVPEEVKSSDEVPKEKIKELIQLVPIEEIDKEDLNQLWALMKETLSIRPATDEKEMELLVELKRLYEPDVEDYLWTHTQHIMHAPVKWSKAPPFEALYGRKCRSHICWAEVGEEFGKFTSRDSESLELYYSRFYKMMNELVRNQCDVTNHQEIDKLMALISLSFKKIYKPTNNNLRTSSNTSRANQDNFATINRGTRYDNQRIGNVVGARETVGTMVVQKSRIQCYNCKEYGHVARECQKAKRLKDAAYHKENMLLCRQHEAGFQLNAEQADWRDDTDDEPED
nr:putative ribonuclease H-like domain-containing protein [Tanacetum cinerariifolium]